MLNKKNKKEVGNSSTIFKTFDRKVPKTHHEMLNSELDAIEILMRTLRAYRIYLPFWIQIQQNNLTRALLFCIMAHFANSRDVICAPLFCDAKAVLEKKTKKKISKPATKHAARSIIFSYLSCVDGYANHIFSSVAKISQHFFGWSVFRMKLKITIHFIIFYIF